MKRTIISVLALLATLGTRAQNAYYDALYLSSHGPDYFDGILYLHKESLDSNQILLFPLTDQEVETLKNTLSFFKAPLKKVDNFNLERLKIIDKNFRNYVNSINKSEFAVSGFGSLPSGVTSLLSNLITGDFQLGEEDQTKILDGLTKYYVEEFKKAATISYMNTFNATIGKYGDLQVLFPKTYQKLSTADPFKFPDLGDEYKEIFNQDLKALLENTIAYIENPPVRMELLQSTSSNDPPTFYLLTESNVNAISQHSSYEKVKLLVDISSKLINQYHPVDLFNYLDAKYYHGKDKDLPIPKLIRGINLIQSNLLDTTKAPTNQFDNVWINFEQLKQLNTIEEWSYFLGLIYQQDPDFFDQLFPGTINENGTINPENLDETKRNIHLILNSLIQIQDLRANLTQENLDDNFVAYMHLVINALESIPIKVDKDGYTTFLRVADHVINLYENTRDKDYSNSIHYLLQILTEFIPEGTSAHTEAQKLFNVLDTYGAFMANVVNAKDADEIKGLIREFAAPPASFIQKRELKSTISVTGQPGFFLGPEILNEKTAFQSGLSLPMGLEWSFHWKKRTASQLQASSDSWSVFAQLIDLGAILNFRLDDSTSELPEKVEVQQFFSPGISLNYGFKNSPMTLGIGYQHTPELRQITPQDNSTGSVEDMNLYQEGDRFFIRLAWDIPLINIGKWKYKPDKLD